MSVLIRGMKMPNCYNCTLKSICSRWAKHDVEWQKQNRDEGCPLVEIPTPHGDLIDRDALIKDGWLNLHKEVMVMGGYAIHELPLKNPSIPVIISTDKDGDT